VSLRVNINRLTLPAMSRRDSALVVSSLQQKLSELANQSPAPDWSNLSGIDNVDGGSLPRGARPREIGSHLATQIFRRLGS
jgi:hypothetical protein